MLDKNVLIQLQENDPSITYLDLMEKDIGPEEAKALAKSLEINTVVDDICLYDNYIGDEGVIAIANALKLNNRVKELNVGNSPDNERRVTAMPFEDFLKESQHVSLKDSLLHNGFSRSKGNNVGPDGAKALAELLKINAALKKIGLDSNQINAEGAIFLADAIKSNTSLMELTVDSNNIGSNGAKALAESLKFNATLKYISLNNNHIGTEGVIFIADTIKSNQSLVHLDLNNNNIGTQGVIAVIEAMKSNTTLQRVHFSEKDVFDMSAYDAARSSYPIYGSIISPLLELMANNYTLTSVEFTPRRIPEVELYLKRNKKIAACLDSIKSIESFDVATIQGKIVELESLVPVLIDGREPLPISTSGLAEGYRLLKAFKSLREGGDIEARASFAQPFTHPYFQTLADKAMRLMVPIVPESTSNIANITRHYKDSRPSVPEQIEAKSDQTSTQDPDLKNDDDVSYRIK